MRRQPTIAAQAAVHTALSELSKRNISVNGVRTSVRLEPQMWDALHEIAENERLSLHELCTFINDRKHSDSSLTSALRVFIVSYYRAHSESKSGFKPWDGQSLLET